MDTRTFERESIRASTMQTADPDQAEYWQGYRRGLRRAHFGESFGTDDEHALWMSLAESADRQRADRGRGYRDGLAVDA